MSRRTGLLVTPFLVFARPAFAQSHTGAGMILAPIRVLSTPEAPGFAPILLGACGPYAGFLAAPGWDACTGVASPNGKDGK